MRAAQLGVTPTEPVRSTGRTRWSPSQAERLWDDHGSAVYALACALLDEEVAAKRAVVLGMTDFVGSHLSPGDDARRSLARHVYWRCTELASETPGTPGLPPTVAWIGQLVRLQRACLALCIFGGHTYRDAADLLGIPPLTVAGMLTSGLEGLSACQRPTHVQ